MFVTNWISTTKIQKISEITNFFRHYFLSRTEVTQGNIPVVPVSLKAVEGCLIMQRSAVLPVLQQQDDKEVHELE